MARLILFLIFLLQTALALPRPADFDVIIIGGGPGGLSALSAFARLRRTAVAFDSGEYRNLATRHQHDILGADGEVPAVFRALAREQILKYPTVSIVNTTITGLEKLDSHFSATDVTGKVYTARKVILSTGMTDVLPRNPGVSDAWGKGMYWCPWCDGYENRDRKMGVLGTFGAGVARTSIYIQSLNRDVVIYANGSYTADNMAAATSEFPAWEQELKALNVGIDNRAIASFTRLSGGEGSDEFRITFTNGETTIREAFVVDFPSRQTSNLGERLGVKIEKNKMVVDEDMHTAVDGVYAVGDANSDGSTNVPHAMSSAKRAGVEIVHELALEDASGLVKRNVPKKRSLAAEVEHLEVEEIWKALSA